ncbi:alpha/beta-hydrolase [Sodiomyces alkalinus F11]|uniref:Alpha/beta-hydrolase n=1 Tax=Sodiomyces alkalinus (strain CBS 110278 / VKM F-3762 / F11) TaxID=1314773 RepID=A0A3N2PZX9_SODAK|nr:alpha/beta-hydrolase [Sodiomyces alkalinus F11]ROT40042.1 alpha/beta-hydrolase [Sodiomyces alkalinus F11]
MHLSPQNRLLLLRVFRLLLAIWLLGIVSFSSAALQEPLVTSASPQPVSVAVFSSLERLSRLVDITYCVGNTGMWKPFKCASRCNEFPTLTLETTWQTGILMSDSCGFIAVDHGIPRPDAGEGNHDPLAEKAIIVAFRGTYSIANTIIDLSTMPQQYVPYPSPDDGGGKPPRKPSHRCDNCTVHSGFLASWRQARDVVLPEMKALRQKYPGYPIRLVGHSLGGAVAMLAALEMRVSLGWWDTVVTTFGEPRVGNQELCDYLDAVFELSAADEINAAEREYRRVTHADDPVPLLPPAEWGYSSHGGEFFISKKDLPPSVEDVLVCRGDYDENCIARDEGRVVSVAADDSTDVLRTGEGQDAVAAERFNWIPARFRLWQLFFAHRDYFWRLGLCVPGGDPANWGREKAEGGGGGGGEEAHSAEL